MVDVSNDSFERLVNCRDISSVSSIDSSVPRILPGRIYRGVAPWIGTKSDRNRLTQELKIRCWIDLRSDSEKQSHFDELYAQIGHVSDLNSDYVPREQFVFDVDLIGNKELLKMIFLESSLWNKVLLSFFALTRNRKRIGQLIFQHMLDSGGLLYFTTVMIDLFRPRIIDVLRAFTRTDLFPIYLHCSIGKDRTGIIVALLLSILDVPREVIVQDYSRSEKDLLPRRVSMERRYEEILGHTRYADLPDAPPQVMESALAHIDETYGSLLEYLIGGGLTVDEIVQIRQNLLETPNTEVE